MTDREKVISALEKRYDPERENLHLVFIPNGLVRDTLALLKEQDEGIEPEIYRESVTETTVSLWYKCGACGGEIEQGDDEFCRHCGKKVKWYD